MSAYVLWCHSTLRLLIDIITEDASTQFFGEFFHYEGNIKKIFFLNFDYYTNILNIFMSSSL